MNADRLESPTMNLRAVATSVLAVNYLVAEHKKAMLNECLVQSTILALQGKFARELYRRAVEHGELCVQVDNRTYLIEPKAYNEVELLEILGGERAD
jgi:hypothetical protein